MAGAFQTSRDIFTNPIWQDIPKFRIFFFIVGNAVFSEDGVRIGNIHLQRGQFLRSYRNLREDLHYIENRAIKKYSLSMISKKIEQLVKENRLKIEESELGTVFTVVNYALYQGLENYKKTTENAERTAREHSENAERTEREQNENNNKKDNKDKNVKKDKKDNKKIKYAEFVFLEESEFQKLVDEHGQALTEKMIETLDNYKGANGKKYKSDYRAILNWVKDKVLQDQRKPHGKNRVDKLPKFMEDASHKPDVNINQQLPEGESAKDWLKSYVKGL